ncbi:SgcJ/EcaC family oxidoreductase [Cnuibacter sp. UC19_7]|uniref:SgcJ/EcaC family oxidoreductase n=1 Tax=Cnuibacter sp. UC19_7 TaxID=3350166 RepID=UPI00366E4E4F
MTNHTLTIAEANDAVDRILTAYLEAWDAGDADAFGALFTDDATYVIFLGDALLGREAITENHRDVFTKWQAGTRLRVEPLAVQVLGADAVSVLTAGGIDTDPEAIELDKLQTFTLVRTAEGWRIAAFHNTSMSRWTRPKYNPGSAALTAA